jgi:hypothetical protein
MPCYYTDTPAATQTTSATPNSANDCFFLNPGATQSLWLMYVIANGKAAALTALSGINIRIEKWTSTPSSGGTAITPAPTHPGYQAAKHTAGYSASTVTSGTGGPTILGSFGFGVSSPGVWGNPTGQATNLDAAYALPGGSASNSIDLFNISPTASLNFELTVGTAE